jgi:hypothetical protein
MDMGRSDNFWATFHILQFIRACNSRVVPVKNRASSPAERVALFLSKTRKNFPPRVATATSR